MEVLFDDELQFHYGFLWFDTGVGSDVELVSARGGQVTGILGVAEPGLLSMVIGMHSGLVPVRVEVHASRPPQQDWPDVVEASLEARGPEVALGTFDDWRRLTLPRSGSYRVRWHDDGADAGRDEERYDTDAPVVERCLLQLWPEAPGAPAVVREGSAVAAHWRGVAERAAPPAPVEERALAEEQARLEGAAQELAWRRQAELERWGGREPSARLLEVEREVLPLIDGGRRDLAETLVALPPAAQHVLALELVRRACAGAGDGTLDWQPALDALEHRQPLPAPFRTSEQAYSAAFPEPSTVSVTATATAWSGPIARGTRPARQPLHPAAAAVGAVLAAGRADPLAAVLGTVEAVSWSAPDLDAYFAEIGARVSGLSGPGS